MVSSAAQSSMSGLLAWGLWPHHSGKGTQSFDVTDFPNRQVDSELSSPSPNTECEEKYEGTTIGGVRSLALGRVTTAWARGKAAQPKGKSGWARIVTG